MKQGHEEMEDSNQDSVFQLYIFTFQPPTPNMSMGPGGMGQSGGHAPSNLNDNIAPGLPPASMMQSQMSNGEILTQMFIYQINSGPHELYFPHKPRLCVHTYSSIFLSIPCLERSSDPDFAACLSADTIPCLLCHGVSLLCCLIGCNYLWSNVQPMV